MYGELMDNQQGGNEYENRFQGNECFLDDIDSDPEEPEMEEE